MRVVEQRRAAASPVSSPFSSRLTFIGRSSSTVIVRVHIEIESETSASKVIGWENLRPAKSPD